MAHLYVQAASTQKKRSSSRTTRMSYPMISKCFIPPSEMSSTLQRLTSASIARRELPGALTPSPAPPPPAPAPPPPPPPPPTPPPPPSHPPPNPRRPNPPPPPRTSTPPSKPPA